MVKVVLVLSLAGDRTVAAQVRGAGQAESDPIKLGRAEDYNVTGLLSDRGGDCHVYKGIHLASGREVAIKVHKPGISLRQIKKEIQITQHLAGGPNIVKLLDIVPAWPSGRPCLIFEFITATSDSISTTSNLTDSLVRHWAFEFLKALNFTHSQGVIHFDMRFDNFLYDDKSRQGRLIDFLDAHFDSSSDDYCDVNPEDSVMPPESRLKGVRYGSAWDMWGFGCLLATLVLHGIFFTGPSGDGQWVDIVEVLGTDAFLAWARKYHLQLDEDLPEALGSSHHPGTEWSEFVDEANSHLASPELFDLLDRLLVFDPEGRLSAGQAMSHRYFDPVRRREGRCHEEDMQADHCPSAHNSP